MQHHAHNPSNRPAEDPDAVREPVSAGERAEELLVGAVADALTEGTSWSQIGARLGVILWMLRARRKAFNSGLNPITKVAGTPPSVSFRRLSRSIPRTAT